MGPILRLRIFLLVELVRGHRFKVQNIAFVFELLLKSGDKSFELVETLDLLAEANHFVHELILAVLRERRGDGFEILVYFKRIHDEFLSVDGFLHYMRCILCVLTSPAFHSQLKKYRRCPLCGSSPILLVPLLLIGAKILLHFQQQIHGLGGNHVQLFIVDDERDSGQISYNSQNGVRAYFHSWVIVDLTNGI